MQTSERFRVENLPNGSASLQDVQIGESMHSFIGAWNEANLVYVAQAGLDRLCSLQTPAPLVIFDIGFGIGSNAFATLEYLDKRPSNRKIHLVSFETDIAGLTIAQSHLKEFPFLEGKQEILRKLFQSGSYEGETSNGTSIRWDFKMGDFRKTFDQCPRPELIYYDLYSPKVNPHLWNLETFRLIFEKSQTSDGSEARTTLLTYCTATAVRSALLLAGFYVGHGNATPSKKETTVASTLAELTRPLGKAWADHLRRSGRPFPPDLPPAQWAATFDLIESQLNF